MVSELTNYITKLAEFIYGKPVTANTGKYKPRNSSIHPRVVDGVTKHRKVNTCRKANPGKKAKLIGALMEHVSRHPHDFQSSNRLAKLSV